MSDATQTSVSINPAAGAPGLEYDIADNDVVTKIASEPISFGKWVNISEDSCELPDSSGEVSAEGGVALWDRSLPSGDGYVTGDAVRVLKKGRVWVEVEATVAAGAVAYARFTATGTATKGSWGASTGGGELGAVPSGLYYKSGATGGLAVVSINLPTTSS